MGVLNGNTIRELSVFMVSRGVAFRVVTKQFQQQFVFDATRADLPVRRDQDEVGP